MSAGYLLPKDRHVQSITRLPRHCEYRRRHLDATGLCASCKFNWRHRYLGREHADHAVLPRGEEQLSIAADAERAAAKPAVREVTFAALHSKHSRLARSGGVRTGRPIVPVPRPPHPRQTNPHRRNRRLGARPQCQPRQSKLAIHYTHRTHQTSRSRSH
jgi:hypothetical protein